MHEQKYRGEVDMTDVVPKNIDAEQKLLGSILMTCNDLTWDVTGVGGLDDGRELLKSCTRIASPEDMWDVRHRKIYKAMIELASEGKPPDTLLLVQKMMSNGLDAIGAAKYASYIGVLWRIQCTSVLAESYAAIVHDFAERRRGVEQGHRIMQDAWSGRTNDMRIDEQWAQK